MIPKSEIEAVKERADIAAIISEYGVELKGHSTLEGLCPFHDETGPSFKVRPDFGTYRCFGCGESGDVFSFIQAKDGLGFSDAVKLVAERYNIEIHDTADNVSAEERNQKALLFDLMSDAAAFFAEQFAELDDDHPAKVELSKRKLDKVKGRPTWLEDFGVGYAPQGWSTTLEHLVSRGHKSKDIIEAGMAGRTEQGRLYDMFRGRLVWFIKDVRGRVVGFGARKLFENDNGPKYLNSPQTPLYDKSRVLYGLDLARKPAYDTKEIYVVEGYTDVMALSAAGIENVVATSGTAFGEQHAHTIKRILGDQGRIVFNFDGDEAGQKAAYKTFSLKAPIHNSSYVTNHGTGDPCDIRLAQGDEGVRNLVAESNRIPLTEFVLKQEHARHDTATPEGRSNFLHAAAPLLTHITDYSIREDYLKKIAYWSGATLDVVRRLMQTAARRDLDSSDRVEFEETESTPLSEQKQQSIIALLLQYPLESYKALASSPVPEEYFADELRPVYLEVWSIVNALQGDLGRIDPEEFSKPKLIAELGYKNFREVEESEGDEKPKTVKRLLASFVKAIEDIKRSEEIRQIQTQFTNAYGDESASSDLDLFSEIVERNKRLRRK